MHSAIYFLWSSLKGASSSIRKLFRFDPHHFAMRRTTAMRMRVTSHVIVMVVRRGGRLTTLNCMRKTMQVLLEQANGNCMNKLCYTNESIYCGPVSLIYVI